MLDSPSMSCGYSQTSFLFYLPSTSSNSTCVSPSTGSPRTASPTTQKRKMLEKNDMDMLKQQKRVYTCDRNKYHDAFSITPSVLPPSSCLPCVLPCAPEQVRASAGLPVSKPLEFPAAYTRNNNSKSDSHQRNSNDTHTLLQHPPSPPRLPSHITSDIDRYFSFPTISSLDESELSLFSLLYSFCDSLNTFALFLTHPVLQSLVESSQLTRLCRIVDFATSMVVLSIPHRVAALLAERQKLPPPDHYNHNYQLTHLNNWSSILQLTLLYIPWKHDELKQAQHDYSKCMELLIDALWNIDERRENIDKLWNCFQNNQSNNNSTTNSRCNSDSSHVSASHAVVSGAFNPECIMDELIYMESEFAVFFEIMTMLVQHQASAASRAQLNNNNNNKSMTQSAAVIPNTATQELPVSDHEFARKTNRRSINNNNQHSNNDTSTNLYSSSTSVATSCNSSVIHSPIFHFDQDYVPLQHVIPAQAHDVLTKHEQQVVCDKNNVTMAAAGACTNDAQNIIVIRSRSNSTSQNQALPLHHDNHNPCASHRIININNHNNNNNSALLPPNHHVISTTTTTTSSHVQHHPVSHAQAQPHHVHSTTTVMSTHHPNMQVTTHEVFTHHLFQSPRPSSQITIKVNTNKSDKL